MAGFVSVAAGALAIAGSGARNTITDTVQAFANGGSSLTTTGSGGVRLAATDEASIDSTVFAGAIAISAGVGVSVALGVSAADNEIHDTTQAFGDGATITSAGALTIAATADPTVSSLTIAAAVSGVVNGPAISGAGDGSTNNIGNTVESYLKGADASHKSTYTAVGDIALSASEAATTDAEVGTGALAAASIGGSVGISVALSSDTSTVDAYTDNAGPTTTGGAIDLSATTADTIKKTLAVATSIAAAIGAAGAGAGSPATVSPTVRAYAGAGCTLSARRRGDRGDDERRQVQQGRHRRRVRRAGQRHGDGDGQRHGGGARRRCHQPERLGDDPGAGDGHVERDGLRLAGGVVVGSGAGTTATTSPTVKAYTGSGAQVTATHAVAVTATPQAIAHSVGVDVGGLAFGARRWRWPTTPRRSMPTRATTACSRRARCRSRRTRPWPIPADPLPAPRRPAPDTS